MVSVTHKKSCCRAIRSSGSGGTYSILRRTPRVAPPSDSRLSEFLVESGRERAERVLADRSRFVLSPARWRAFTAALDRAPREIPAVVDLLRRRRPK